MLRRWLLALVVLSLAPLGLSLSSVAGSSPLGPTRYIVVMKDSAPVPDVAATATGLGATIDSTFGLLNTLVMSLSPRDVTRLRHDPRVAFVTPDRPVRLLADSSGGTAPGGVPTGVARIGAGPALRADGTAAPAPARKAAVALLDTGVSTRPDLNVVGGYDCAPSSGLLDGLFGGGRNNGGGDNAIPVDNNGHGTHVAGIVADKGIAGVVGVSPGTPLYAVRVFGADGSGSIANVICGLNWLAANAKALNIKVVNMSLGGEGTDDGTCGTSDDDAFHAAVCKVTAAGVTVVAAAGNDGGDLAQSTPGAYDEVLAVTAMADFDGLPGGLSSTAPCAYKGQDDTAATFSDYAVPGSADAKHTIAAPGVCITSTWNDGGVETISGTSMASPHIAGLVARCIDAGPCADMTPAQIVTKLLADAAARPADTGFFGDTNHPVDGKYFGNLADDLGY
ncbi:MAG: S8 family serine peptidase [Actinobacteria bacterium]|nr:S8 family serine peptidase [Actinomycetota bacterium]